MANSFVVEDSLPALGIVGRSCFQCVRGQWYVTSESVGTAKVPRALAFIALSAETGNKDLADEILDNLENGGEKHYV